MQHRMVDMYMAVEQAVSATYLATLRLDTPPPVRSRAVSAAKVTIARALRLVGQEAVQLHGGMGRPSRCRSALLQARDGDGAPVRLGRSPHRPLRRAGAGGLGSRPLVRARAPSSPGCCAAPRSSCCRSIRRGS
ncbi:acyl-CoA dehydrogenase family protein [Sphingomonas sp. MMS24-JH45]